MKQTRVYQEGKEEGAREEKFKMIPLLLRLGLSFQEKAKELSLSLEEVQQEMQKQQSSQDM